MEGYNNNLVTGARSTIPSRPYLLIDENLAGPSRAAEVPPSRLSGQQYIDQLNERVMRPGTAPQSVSFPSLKKLFHDISSQLTHYFFYLG